MIRLLNRNNAKELLILDSPLESRCHLEDLPAPFNPAQGRINGVFDSDESCWIGFFAFKGGIYVRRNDFALKFEPGDKIELEKSLFRRRRLSVIRNDEVLAELAYRAKRVGPGGYGSFEEEDFDFGVFVESVMKSNERKSLVLRNWSSDGLDGAS